MTVTLKPPSTPLRIALAALAVAGCGLVVFAGAPLVQAQDANPVLAKVKGNGTVLVTSGKISKDTGKATFDGIVAQKEWAKANADFMAKFLKAIAAADDDYRKNAAKWTKDSDQVKAVAKVTGAKPEDVPAGMKLYRFPTLAEQVSPTWLGGGAKSGAAASLAATAAFLKAQGTIQNVLPDYATGVNPSYAQAAAK